MKRFLILPFLIILFSGCKHGPVVVTKDPGPAQLPQGAILAESSDRTVSVVVPNGWRRGGPDSMSAPSLGDMMGSMGGSGGGIGSSDQAGEAQTAADLEKKGVLIWINDSSKPIPGEERTHFSIKLLKGEGKSLEEAVEDAKGDLINEAPPTYVELPIGRVGRLQAKNTKIDGGELNQVLYLIVNGNDVYKVRFATQNGDTVIPQVEDQVMQSLRIKPAKP
jgi:hypothetical protein